MSMTMTQKILAAHAGLPEVRAGQLIQAKLDMVLGNDITSPVAINEFEKAGFDQVFDQEQGGDDHGPLCPQQGHQGRHPVQAVPDLCPALRPRRTTTMWARWALSTPWCRKRA